MPNLFCHWKEFHQKQLRYISHDKMAHLANNCVTMNEFMDNFYENNELSDVICEHCYKLGGKISKANLKKHQSVLKTPMNIRIFLQGSDYNVEIYEY